MLEMQTGIKQIFYIDDVYSPVRSGRKINSDFFKKLACGWKRGAAVNHKFKMD